MLEIRRSRDRLIFNMEIPIHGKDGLYIETDRGLDLKDKLGTFSVREYLLSSVVLVLQMRNSLDISAPRHSP